MVPLDITFETQSAPQTFAHIASSDGVWGHAKEMRERIPAGTWLTLQPSLWRLSPYLVKHCGFQYRGCLVVGDELHELFLKVT